jgi:UDP-N-acetylmuramate--alanine ligase
VADSTVTQHRHLARLKPGAHIHLIGIGGAGLSAIARVLMGLGYRVSGSDQSASALTSALAKEGATVYTGHRPGNVAGADLVVVSSAVPQDNVEWKAARAQSIAVIKRPELLGEMMAGRTAVAVAGTHGKTTTSGMIATMLLVAGQIHRLSSAAIAHQVRTPAGAGPFVVEDEYDRPS